MFESNMDEYLDEEVEYVKQEAKMVYLLECIQKTPPPVIVFSDNKNEVDGASACDPSPRSTST